jgi:citrate lyase beta subunit
MLMWMAGLPGIHAVDGFVLPKVEAGNVAHWLSIMLATNHAFMPTIEELTLSIVRRLSKCASGCCPCASGSLRSVLAAMTSSTFSACGAPGIARPTMDRSALSSGTLPQLLSRQGSRCGPVFEHYASVERLREEVERDIEHGLFTKTAIHPCQIGMIHGCYQPSACELLEAQAILEADARAVFGSRGSMCEPATHRRWAGNIIARARVFGVAESDLVPAVRVA